MFCCKLFDFRFFKIVVNKSEFIKKPLIFLVNRIHSARHKTTIYHPPGLIKPNKLCLIRHFHQPWTIKLEGHDMVNLSVFKTPSRRFHFRISVVRCLHCQLFRKTRWIRKLSIIFVNICEFPQSTRTLIMVSGCLRLWLVEWRFS
jgi:hypothetical protein